jgi:LacI family transcriptional regulator
MIGGYLSGYSKEFKNSKIVGAVEELAKNGISFDFDRDYEPCSYSAESGYKAAEKLMSRSPDLTAIFALSDSIAIGAIRALKDIGLRVPEEVSVIGFDGLTMAKYSVPRLSTIQQDTAMLAKKSVDDLLMRISYGGPAVHELIPYEYIEGESVGPSRKI